MGGTFVREPTQGQEPSYIFPAYPSPRVQPSDPPSDTRSSDEDGTLQDEHDERNDDRLRVTTSFMDGSDYHNEPRAHSPISGSENREQGTRMNDDMEMLRVEQVVSSVGRSSEGDGMRTKNSALNRTRTRTMIREEDVFDTETTPLHEKSKIYQPPPHPGTRLARFIKRVHNSSFLVRYFVYITPLTLILLIPILLGLLLFKNASVGGVRLIWFSIWLLIIWLSLWAGRLIAKAIPYPMGLISSIFTNNSKKWRDLGKTLEIPATLFFWWLAIEVSFLPTMKNHHLNGDKTTRRWERTTNKVLVSVFIGMILNFIAKIVIQLIAISFHLRTYSDRIEVNKFQISSLVKLYTYSREKIAADDSEFEEKDGPSGPGSGARTPMLYITKAGKGARHAMHKVGDVAGKVAGDFTGKAITSSTHPHQVILQLLSTNSRSQILARRLWRTYRREEQEHVTVEDLKAAFENDDEADAAFLMFDKDLNGDISMEELEAVCVEIGRERKAITASLKDLDSVISKLDDFLLFVVFIITALVLISLLSTSAAGVLTSAGSAVLALSWLFAATAQEFLQSVIFVFVKHPFDVGDRVTIYGNTGSLLTGDDYFVKEISLLYTEFKKMEGHIVQAPNSYLNTLFILNQRRSGGLAEAVPVTVKFGTTIDQIEDLRNRLLAFVTAENREYNKNILTELRHITDGLSITVNVVFFYKSNWQNELLRLQRRNKFICALMVTMQELGIEGPHRILPGNVDFPVHLQGAYPSQRVTPYTADNSQSPGPGPRSGTLAPETPHGSSRVPNEAIPPRMVPQSQSQLPARHASILRNRAESSTRRRGETLSSMGRRVDFSLGMSSISAGEADFGDVFDDKPSSPFLGQTSFGYSSTRSGASHRPKERKGSDEIENLARSSSRDSAGTTGAQLGRITSAGSANGRVSHRNRFFSRGRSKLGKGEGDAQDLEAGRRDIGVGDMPDIPEASGGGTGMVSDEEEAEDEHDRLGKRTESARRRGTVTGEGEDISHSKELLDPRSGVVSPQAVVSDETRDKGGVSMLGGDGAGGAPEMGVRRVRTQL